MNIKLIKEKWIKYYKRGFLTGLFVMSFICLIDQVLQSPFFFNKIESINVFLFTLSFIFFGSVFCGMLSFVILVILSLVTVPNN
jgi:hypothetical protein